MTPRTLRPIDPFQAGPGGRYQDDVVTVIHRPGRRELPGEKWSGRTAHFAVGVEDGRLSVLHSVEPRLLDDVAQLISDELFTPGWVSSSETFERILTGIVLSTADDPPAAWEAFYEASLAKLESLLNEGSTSGLVPIYRRAQTLVTGDSLLDLGSCFGLFPLRMRRTLNVEAADVSGGTCDLLRRMSTRLGLEMTVTRCDAAAVPRPDGCADTVTLLHVLEHVDAEHGRRMLAEAARVARRQVIVAVPLEEEPTPEHGHVRTISLDDLCADARTLGGGWHHQVDEFHGGWLILTR